MLVQATQRATFRLYQLKIQHVPFLIHLLAERWLGLRSERCACRRVVTSHASFTIRESLCLMKRPFKSGVCAWG